MWGWQRWAVGGLVVIVAIAALTGMFVIIAVFASESLIAALAAVTAPLGAIVGAYFGVAASTAEAHNRVEHEENRTQDLQQRLDTLRNQAQEQQHQLGQLAERVRTAEGTAVPDLPAAAAEPSASVAPWPRSSADPEPTPNRGIDSGSKLERSRFCRQ